MTPAKSDPVAWLAFATDGSESNAVYATDGEAQAAADAWGWTVMPLYLAPRLTDAERETIEAIFVDPDSAWSADNAATLRGLLERLSPVATPDRPCTPAECSVQWECTDTGEK